MSQFAKMAATPVSDVTSKPALSVSPETSLQDVVQSMSEGHGSAVLVVDAGKVVGIFTERDLMKRVNHQDHSWHRVPVREVMTKDPTTIRRDETIEDAINKMTVGSFRRIPRLDLQGNPDALLTIRDILSCMVEFYPQEFVNLPPDPSREATGPWGG